MGQPKPKEKQEKEKEKLKENFFRNFLIVSGASRADVFRSLDDPKVEG